MGTKSGVRRYAERNEKTKEVTVRHKGGAFGRKSCVAVEYDFVHVHGKRSLRKGHTDTTTGKFIPAVERRTSLV